MNPSLFPFGRPLSPPLHKNNNFGKKKRRKGQPSESYFLSPFEPRDPPTRWNQLKATRVKAVVSFYPIENEKKL